MRRLRDVFYIYGNTKEKYYIYYGMEFREFRQYIPITVENMLVLAGGEAIGECYNMRWYLETIQGANQIRALENEDLYALGNFHWIDYNSEEFLNACTPEEKAELIYLSHFGKPLNSAFIERIQNNFVYLAHDDVWFCKLFCKDMAIMVEVVAKKLINHFSSALGVNLPDMSDAVKCELALIMAEGMLIDFDSLIAGFDDIYSIALYSIGEFTDMDDVYSNRKKHMSKASRKCYLEYGNGKWDVETY